MMPCPKCSGKTQVLDTVTNKNRVIRRRHCMACTYDWYTMETLLVSDKRSEDLHREYTMVKSRNGKERVVKKLIKKYSVSSEEAIIPERIKKAQ